MSLSPPAYQYASIGEEGTIRIILLQPAKVREDGIQCSLVQATLEELDDDVVEHYVALSYVWGDPNDTRVIAVDGCELEITASLDSALRHLRDPMRVLRVWADGICINQKDVQDRNQQVLQMGLIYSHAQHTIIFIGESNPHCDAFMRFLRSHRFTSEDLHPPSDVCLSTWFPPSPSSATEEYHILHAPWFTRVWVLQELVLSSDPWLQCGSYRVRWAVFSSVVLSAAPSPSPQTAARVAILQHMNEARSNFYQMKDRLHLTPPGHLLLELLLGRKGFGVSDPRDMIYAHLGLTDSTTRAAIPVDYNKSVAQVYEDVARQYIEWKGNLSVLIFAEEVELEKRRDRLPSWVPDWTIPQITSTEKRPLINNHHDENTNLREEIISTALPSILGVVGWSHGTIQNFLPSSSLNQIPSNIPSILTLLHQPDSFIYSLLPALLDFNTSIYLSFPLWRRDFLFSAEIPVLSGLPFFTTIPPTLQTLLDASKSKDGLDIPTDSMISRILLNLLQLRDYSTENPRSQIAVLEKAQLIEVPASTCIGDVIAHFHGEGEGTSHFILRPVKVEMGEREIGSELIEDINTRWKSNLVLKHVRHCQFVKRGGRLLYHGYEAALLKGTEPVVFALH